MIWRDFWDRWCIVAKTRAVWVSHGTRILGSLMTAFGLLAFIDRATIDSIGALFGPKYEPFVVRGLVVIAGLAVARRGFYNSRRSDNDPK